MTYFWYILPDGELRQINLRLNPNEVSWTYKLNTSTTDTIGGQVIQLLSVNIDQVMISGRFGKEGPRGSMIITDAEGRRKRVWRPRSQQFDYRTAQDSYGIGLTQMTEFFREYFTIASQGADPDVGPYRFVQTPMHFRYDGSDIRDPWVITPTEFPSYKRANNNFAPEWKVIASVYEAPDKVQETAMRADLRRLEAIIGFRNKNPWSDPLAGQQGLSIEVEDIASQFKALLPDFTAGEIEDLIWRDLSLPNILGYGNLDPSPDPDVDRNVNPNIDEDETVAPSTPTIDEGERPRSSPEYGMY